MYSVCHTPLDPGTSFQQEVADEHHARVELEVGVLLREAVAPVRGTHFAVTPRGGGPVEEGVDVGTARCKAVGDALTPRQAT
jgi:hypothetical protein